MATFTGTDADEFIVSTFVSPTVVVTGGGTLPSNDADIINSGGGNDQVQGGGGADQISLGDGFDSVFWNSGDGNDVIDGGADLDFLEVIGRTTSAVGEFFDLSANGSHALLTLPVDNVTLDLNSIEEIEIDALGGADQASVGDLTGTGITRVVVNLTANLGSLAGDNATDAVTVFGTGGNDAITVVGSAGGVSVRGLTADVDVLAGETSDLLLVAAGGGDDSIRAESVQPGSMHLVLLGGDGNDSVVGSAGADNVDGGAGNDRIVGRGGDDVLLGDAGNDEFAWFAGEGSDTIEGGADLDTLDVTGNNASESFSISANGGRARLLRSVDGAELDLNDVERIELTALGAADTINVSSLAGTDVKEVAIDLRGGSGNGDGAQDFVNLFGADGNDVIGVSASSGVIAVSGLGAQVTVEHAEADDILEVRGGSGDDSIDATGLPAGLVTLVLNGGSGNDTLASGFGDDTLSGGIGDDIFKFGPNGGADFVTDFTAGAGTVDKIDLRAFAGIHSLDDVLSRATEVSSGAVADTLIDFGNGDTLLLQDVGRDFLSEDDFVLADAPNGRDAVTGPVNISAAGDFDSDGMQDYIWRDADAAMTMTEYNAMAQQVTHVDLGPVGFSWNILAGDHFSNASTTQMLAQSTADGTMSLWWVSNGQRVGVDIGKYWNGIDYLTNGEFTNASGVGISSFLVANAGDNHLYDWWIDANNQLQGIDLGAVWANKSLVGTGELTPNGKTDFLVANEGDHHLYNWWIDPTSHTLQGYDLGAVWNNVEFIASGKFTANGGGNDNFLVYNEVDHHLYNWWIDPTSHTLQGIDLGAAWNNVEFLAAGRFDNNTTNDQFLVRNTVDNHWYEWWIDPTSHTLQGIDLGAHPGIDFIDNRHFNDANGSATNEEWLVHNSADGHFYEWWVFNNQLAGADLII